MKRKDKEDAEDELETQICATALAKRVRKEMLDGLLSGQTFSELAVLYNSTPRRIFNFIEGK